MLPHALSTVAKLALFASAEASKHARGILEVVFFIYSHSRVIFAVKGLNHMDTASQ